MLALGLARPDRALRLAGVSACWPSGPRCSGCGLAPWLLHGYGVFANSMLAPTGQAELALRVRQLTVTRAEAVDTPAAELRRIERDLHDGAQARLVALGMSLGAAEAAGRHDPEAARALLAEARDVRARPWPSCATWCAASTRRCWPTAAWPARSRRWRWTAPLRVDVASDCRGAWRPRWSRPPTSRSPSCWPTCPSTPRPRRTWIDIRHDRRDAADRRHRQRPGRRRPGSGQRAARDRAPAGRVRRHARREQPAGRPDRVTMEMPCASSSPKTSSSCGTA